MGEERESRVWGGPDNCVLETEPEAKEVLIAQEAESGLCLSL